MMNLKKYLCMAVSLFLLTALLIPQSATAAVHKSEIQDPSLPAFENPDGMTVDLIYYLRETDGSEKVVKKADRTIIPAGTAVVSIEMQEKSLPDGYGLADPQDFPLEEETVEVKIEILPLSEDNTDPSEKPTEPTEKPTEPAEKPTEPAEKPTDPSEKPTDPSEKPTEPVEKPSKPAEKPSKPAGKPTKPAGKPDPTNPQTSDAFSPGLWSTVGLGSASALLLILKKRIF